MIINSVSIFRFYTNIILVVHLWTEIWWCRPACLPVYVPSYKHKHIPYYLPMYHTYLPSQTELTDKQNLVPKTHSHTQFQWVKNKNSKHMNVFLISTLIWPFFLQAEGRKAGRRWQWAWWHTAWLSITIRSSGLWSWLITWWMLGTNGLYS